MEKENSEFSVADWRVRPSLSALEKHGVTISIEPKVMSLLQLLANHAGEVLSRQELEEKLWPDSIVGYDALSKAITKLREALGDDKKQPIYIQTISKKGYRLIAPVQWEKVQWVKAQGEKEEWEKQDPPPLIKHSSSKNPAPWIWGMAFAVIIIALLILWWPKQPRDPRFYLELGNNLSIKQRPVLAIMPFRNISGQANQAFLAQGITSDLITDLSVVSNLWLVNTQALAPYKEGLNPDEARNKFNADYILSGDIIRSQNQIKVNVHLLDAKHSKVVWADRFQRQYSDLFSVQNEMTQQIVKLLSLTLNEKEKQRIAKRYTPNLRAYEYFLHAQSFAAARNPEDNREAIDLYKKAIELDPGFARAYAGLALTYTIAHIRQWPVDSGSPTQDALKYSKRAITLDSELPENFWVASFVNANQKNYSQAFYMIEQCLSLNPNYADAYAMLGWLYIALGKPELTLEFIAKAMRLNPSGGYLYQMQLGRANYFLQRYDQAINNFKQVLQSNPSYLDAMLYMAANYVNLEKLDEARWMYLEIKTLQPNFNAKTWLTRLPFKNSQLIDKLESDLSKIEGLVK